MPIWLAAFAFAVSVALPLLVTSQLDPHQEGGLSYSTWYVAAVGTLLDDHGDEAASRIRLGGHRLPRRCRRSCGAVRARSAGSA